MDELPVEIIGEIFILAAEAARMDLDHVLDLDMPDILPRDIDEMDPTIVIPQVCKRWQQIALGTPQLFTWMVFWQSECWDTSPMKLIPRWLELSGNLSVHIFINPAAWGMGSCFSDVAYDEREGVIESQICGIMQSISRHLHRCKTLTIRSDFQYMDSLLPVGTRNHAPQMETFDIYPHNQDYENDIPPYGQLIAPNLRCIRVGFPPPYLDFLEHNPQLIRRLCSRGYASSVVEVASILQKYQDLEECFLDEMIFRQDDELPSPISLPAIILPRLRSLFLNFICAGMGTSEFFQSLRVQALEELNIDIWRTDGDNTEEMASSFFKIFTSISSIPPLKILSFTNLNVPSDDLLPILRQLDLLETLQIARQRVTPTFIRELIPEGGDTCIVPKLASFTLNQCTLPGASVLRLVEGRIQWLDRTGDTPFEAYFTSNKGFTNSQKEKLSKLDNGSHSVHVS